MFDPIWIPCEGSGCLTHKLTGTGWGFSSLTICSMCGRQVDLDGQLNAVTHNRQDILAMIDRGDFDN